MDRHKFVLKECFICNFCRNICEGNCEIDLINAKNGNITDKNRDLVGPNGTFRKQRINCLGKYCDRPCKYQDLNAEVDVQALIDMIKYLGNKCEELISRGKSLMDYTYELNNGKNEETNERNSEKES